MTNPERLERIQEVISGHSTINIIVTQVDPDAIGSALGLSHILQNMETNSQIWFCGGIGHPQNRSIVNRYDLSKVMKPISELVIGQEEFALVDSSLVDDSRLEDLSGKINPLIIIDHHRTGAVEEDGKMIWVEDIGSACTMVIELIREMDLKFSDNYAYIPVLLAMGVYSDTKQLVNASVRDIEAYNYISKQVSSQEFNILINYPLPDTYYANMLTALQNIAIHGSRLVTHIGKVTSKQGDDLSTIADMLLRHDGITLSVVWGIVDGKVRFSARNNDITTPLDDLLRECFGDKSGAKLTPAGQGEGGGLIDFNLGFLEGEDAQGEILALIKKRMETVIFGSK